MPKHLPTPEHHPNAKLISHAQVSPRPSSRTSTPSPAHLHARASPIHKHTQASPPRPSTAPARGPLLARASPPEQGDPPPEPPAPQPAAHPSARRWSRRYRAPPRLTVPREQTHSVCPIARPRHRPVPRVTAESPPRHPRAGRRRLPLPPAAAVPPPCGGASRPAALPDGPVTGSVTSYSPRPGDVFLSLTSSSPPIRATAELSIPT